MPEPSTFKPVTDSVKQAVKDIASGMKDLGNDLAGKIRATFDEELEEIVSMGEMIFGKVSNFFRGVKENFQQNAENWFHITRPLKNIQNFLKGIFQIEARNEKRRLMGLGLTKKGILGTILKGFGLLLGLGAGLLGAILAPILGPVIKPMQVMAWVLGKIGNKLLTFYKFIKTMSGKDPFGLGAFAQPLKKGGRLFRLFEWFKNLERFIPKGILTASSKGLKWIGKIFGWIREAGAWVMKMGGSKLLSMFMKGLNRVFYPIQIVMSAIEFVKGFMKTEGDIIDKFYGGVKAVIKDFFGLPISLMGKLIDWIAEKFGIENLGAEKFLTDGFNKLVDVFIGIPLFLKDLIKGWLTDAAEWAKNNISGASISSIAQTIGDFFKNALDSILASIYGVVGGGVMEEFARTNKIGSKYMDILKNASERVEEREMTEYQKKMLEKEDEKIKIQKEIAEKTGKGGYIMGGGSGANEVGRMTPDHAKTSRDTESYNSSDPLLGPMM